MKSLPLKFAVRMFGKWMIPSIHFVEAYFLEDALKFRKELNLPLIYVGGLISREKIDEVLDLGFEFVAMARALINEPGFVNRMKQEKSARNRCTFSNYCIARMYSVDMKCHQHCDDLSASIKKELTINKV
jgi:2,4-dienoyl-CoA reductase-like NADH-dependent reductase (Old Yellow Enzyme family)